MEANIIYDDIKDRELVELIDSKFPIFVNYINFNSTKERKEAYRIKSHWAAKANPFVELKEGDKVIKVFYSDAKGDNAINQFINYLNNDRNSN